MEQEILHPHSKEEIYQLKTETKVKRINKKEEQIPRNYSESNFFSKIWYFWVKPAIELANKRPLENKDVCNLSPSQCTSKNMSKFKRIFNIKASRKNNKYPLFFSILSLHFKSLLFIFYLFMFDLGLVYSKIFFFKKIISAFSKGEFFPKRELSFWKVINILNFKFNIIESIFLFIIIKLCASYNYNFLLLQNTILNRRIINETSALLMEKLLKTNSINTNFSKGEGEKLNLLEVDAERIGYFFLWFPRIIMYPFKIFFSLYLLLKIFGRTYIYAILGLVLVIIIIIFFQIKYNRNIKYVLYHRDKRMKIVTFVFTVLKNLKLINLDDEFINRIDIKRNEELSIIRKQFNLEIIIGVLNKNLNLIMMILTLNLFVSSNNEHEISILFTSFQLINTITQPLTVIPIFLSRIAGNLISIKRLQSFLLSEEHFRNQNLNIKDIKNDIIIKFNNTTFGIKNIKKNDKENINAEINSNEMHEEIKLLENISFSVKKGDFIGVFGNTGSGKTCLLNAIMNNYHIISTDSNPKIIGEISFCPSQPWLMTETIKNNIIFFSEINEKKYREIISLCYLRNDFQKLSEGDQTIVNSTCASVSEGEKVRISLARCLYKNADIYLFDDSFSSLDNNINQKIFDGIFCNYLKNKTRIVVMNKKTFLPYVDKIIYLEKGKIAFFGNYEEFKKINKELKDNTTNEDNNEDTEDSEKSNETKIFNENDENNPKNEGILSYYKNANDVLDSISISNVSYKTYLNYINLQGGYSLFFSLIILIIIVKIMEIYRNTIIPSLAKSYNEIKKEKYNKSLNKIFMINLRKKYSIFFNISLGTILMNFIIRFITTRITLYSMRNVHRKMIFRLVKAPINLFHDVVPVGQILNRLTRDVGIIQTIIRTVNSFIKLLFSLVSCMVICYIYNKTIIYISPIIIIYSIILTSYYLNAGRNLTRLQRISFSPIMTIFSETIRGLDIIRTSHMEEHTKNKFLEKIDEKYGIHLFGEGCRRWHAVRRSTFINLIFGIIILYMAYHPEYYSVRAIAIILQYTEEFLNHLINTSTFYIDLENNMIGLERCEQILKIEMEKDSEISNEILTNDNWPKTGNIEFINYNASYRPNTPLILKNINLKIENEEKIGIVGRTGSGKSSLIKALSRIIEPKSGKILIDDFDIQNKNLKVLREKISIFTQEQFLIESTLKDNIDPQGKYSKEAILKIVNDLGLFKNLENEDKLNFEIKENGKNLSTGEKKLINFARAIIRHNKIVILDEPTSSLDVETNEIIHKNIDKYLQDSTTIIITNQVDLLKKCNRIIVIENGEIVEIGKYSKLMKDKKSLFYSLFAK